MNIITTLLETITLPFKQFKKKYLPFIIIYLAYGLAFFITIPQTFWVKEHLQLSSVELIQIAFWTMAPWTMKLFFSQFIENLSIAGNRRKSYIVIGAMLVFSGNLIIIALSNQHTWVQVLGSTYSQLLIASVLITSGLVLQDMIADTLCAELVDRTDKFGQPLSDEKIKHEAGTIQLLGRMSLMLSALIGTFIGGYIASHYKFSEAVWFSLIVPIFSLSAIFTLHSNPTENKDGDINYKLISLGGLLVFASIISEIVQVPYNQEIIFLLNLAVSIKIFKIISQYLPSKNIKEITLISIMIFASRLTPNAGPAAGWWKIDILKFDPTFFSSLAQLECLFGFIGTWLLSNYLLKRDIGIVIISITIINTILTLPYIAMAFGLHEWTEQHLGFGAKTITLVDMAIEGPFSIALLVPILALATYYAPKVNKVTWFALCASWFNLSLIANTLISKYINSYYIVERGKYEFIPHVYVSCMIVSLVIPIATVYICNKYRYKTSNKKTAINNNRSSKSITYTESLNPTNQYFQN